MINLKNAKLESLCIHQVGNKTKGEELLLSQSTTPLHSEKLIKTLHKFFLSQFNVNELYSFSFSNDDFTMNPLFNYALGIFSMPNSLFKNSIDIAKLLYENSTHPQIKSGNLFIAYFSHVNYNEQLTEAVGIFKAENKQSFITIEETQNQFVLDCDSGFNSRKMDKACFIINGNGDHGFHVLVADNPSKSSDTQYWKEDFLNVKPCSNEYNHTKEFLNLTKTFVVEKLKDEFEIDRADQIDMLNRSVDFFKNNEQLEKEAFVKEVFADENIIKSFMDFDKDYCVQRDVVIDECFEISPQAVKKQARFFKSVLKLDKNFHVYIHGNKDMIERGEDENGRKFYKLFFDEES
ncbi:MAG: nucleoid-associated protein [Bacteroidales bacterium]|nr:nucleoid-associated protein [Bacteroidales bacterium]MDY0215699.1 nucleoid-associated protein [Bacteroidales bacterium]